MTLGGLRLIPQWVIMRLTWDGTEARYKKHPCGLDGSKYKIDASLPVHWNSYDIVIGAISKLPSEPALKYAPGFMLTADCGYWCFDLDQCVENGQFNKLATGMLAAFSGAFMEISASGNGAHVIGKWGGAPIEHRNHDVLRQHLEFYSSNKPITFSGNGAIGDADWSNDQQVANLIALRFPPHEKIDLGIGPRPEWRGPADDDELIKRALNAKQSAESAFGGKASFAQLWNGEVESTSENDSALATYFAFWTGCDVARIDRLMRKSGLYREKWDSARRDSTYLMLTIQNACRICKNVYQEPIRSVATQLEMYAAPLEVIKSGEFISAETTKRVGELLDEISGCGTLEEMHNIVIPLIRDAKIPSALCERLVRSINKQLDMWDAKLPVAKLRALVCPPMVQGSSGNNEAPLWVQKHCYVKDGDYFYDMENGSQLTYQGFIAEYGRLMPIRDSGSRENAVEWALHRWGMRTVHKVSYRPDKPMYFVWDGLEYANIYNENSLPEIATQYSEAGIKGIAEFQAHLFDMCGKRVDVFNQILWWMAHNVQKPGVKVRWSPIIKGTPGDGKSLSGAVLRSAMGYRNVKVTGNATLMNSGGFTDWAVGAAVNLIEEIWLTGKKRYEVYNATKEFITNNVVSINPKGSVGYMAYNTTNHFAYSNHNDGLPLEKTDRRWMVVFTPWASLQQMWDICSLDERTWEQRTQAIDYACINCGGELRAWLLSIRIGDEFKKDASAPLTPERLRMMATSVDDAESVAQQIITMGAHGITENVVSSSCLSNFMKIKAIQDGFDLPKGAALNHMLTRMGFSKLEKQVKWRNSTHTVWVKNGISDNNDEIRAILDKSSV